MTVSVENWAEQVRAGDVRAISRAVSAIENREREAEEILRQLFPHTGRAYRVGITGAPGTGKSTLVDRLASHYRAEKKTVGIIAVDPSSPFTGGSILGDRIRMQGHATDAGVFIRSMATRGFLGGLSQATRDTTLLLDAAGKQIILVETVGVGQTETAVRAMVDFFLLVGLAGAGDELQGLKRGIMEMADMVAINKADGSNLPAAEEARTQMQNALHYLHGSASGWTPRTLACSALTGKGIPELWNCVLEYVALTKANGWFGRNRREQAQRWMHEIIQQELRLRFDSQPEIRTRMALLEEAVRDGLTTPTRAAQELLEAYRTP